MALLGKRSADGWPRAHGIRSFSCTVVPPTGDFAATHWPGPVEARDPLVAKPVAGQGWSAADVAQWVADQIRQRGQFTQKHVAYEIRREFGLEFTYTNKNRNLGIDKEVLKRFREQTEDDVVGSRAHGGGDFDSHRPARPGRREISAQLVKTEMAGINK